jgi:hypothetical protein
VLTGFRKPVSYNKRPQLLSATFKLSCHMRAHILLWQIQCLTGGRTGYPGGFLRWCGFRSFHPDAISQLESQAMNLQCTHFIDIGYSIDPDLPQEVKWLTKNNTTAQKHTTLQES